MLRDFRYAILSSTFTIDIDNLEISVLKKFVRTPLGGDCLKILGPFGLSTHESKNPQKHFFFIWSSVEHCKDNC